jgi:hypothetical protein
MRYSRSRLALAAAAGAIALGGCGDDPETRATSARTEPTSPDERLAIQRAEAFLAAMEASDDARACAMMTPKLRQAITTTLRIESVGGTCRTRAAAIYSPAKAPGNAGAKVANIDVDGKTATATVTATPRGDRAAGPVESDVALQRQGGNWLVANF